MYKRAGRKIWQTSTALYYTIALILGALTMWAMATPTDELDPLIQIITDEREE